MGAAGAGEEGQGLPHLGFLSGDPHDKDKAAYADPQEGSPEDHGGGGGAQRMKRIVVQN